MNVPKLRFPEFSDAYEAVVLGEVATFSKGKGISKSDIVDKGETPCIRYGELYTHYGTRIDTVLSATNVAASDLKLSHGGEVIVPASGEDSKDIATACVVIPSGVALGGDLNVIRGDFDGYFLASYISGKRRLALAAMAQGNSVVHLYPSQLALLPLSLPARPEQKKIAAFLGVVDAKIAALRARRDGLERYKRGLMQALFSQTLRFSKPDGTDFPDWKEKRLGEVLHEHKLKSTGNEQVFSVSVHKGLVNQIDHLGRSFSAANTDHYNRVKQHDIVYTKSPTGDFPLGIIKQSSIEEDVIVSPLYGVFTPETPALGRMLHVHFESHVNVSNYLSPIVQKGAKNTINVTNAGFLSNKLKLPVSHEEQQRIADALSAMDAKVAAVADRVAHMEAFKKGLLQQMFV
ncbi:MAG: restriction endonuclease subunit S [Loktanella sp.]|nr:restriction endonuclease subunit S [Loktanella sp.]